jgi:hypothetical protein
LGEDGDGCMGGQVRPPLVLAGSARREGDKIRIFLSTEEGGYRHHTMLMEPLVAGNFIARIAQLLASMTIKE